MDPFAKALMDNLAKGLTLQHRRVSRVIGKNGKVEWEATLFWKNPTMYVRDTNATDMWGNVYDHAIPWRI